MGIQMPSFICLAYLNCKIFGSTVSYSVVCTVPDLGLASLGAQVSTNNDLLCWNGVRGPVRLELGNSIFHDQHCSGLGFTCHRKNGTTQLSNTAHLSSCCCIIIIYCHWNRKQDTTYCINYTESSHFLGGLSSPDWTHLILLSLKPWKEIWINI